MTMTVHPSPLMDRAIDATLSLRRNGKQFRQEKGNPLTSVHDLDYILRLLKAATLPENLELFFVKLRWISWENTVNFQFARKMQVGIALRFFKATAWSKMVGR